MNIDIYLKVDDETNEVTILGGSDELLEAVKTYGTVVAHEVTTGKPFEIYLEDAVLKARQINISG